MAARFPQLIRAAGLTLEALEPHAIASTPGGGAFDWVDNFVCQHAPAWAESGHLSRAELSEVLEGLARLRANPNAVIFSPKVVTAVGRRGQ